MIVALAQIDATVGDVGGNAGRIAAAIAQARAAGARLALTPELAITGYPPEDLLLREGFLHDARAALERVARDARGITALVGFPELDDGGALHNSLAVLADGAVRATYRKRRLPNYGVFDEQRYFAAGAGRALVEPGVAASALTPDGELLEVDGLRVGLTICEDIWHPDGPAAAQARAGAELIVNASASPYYMGRGAERARMLAERARETGAAFAFCALVGGQDELVFDGQSLVVDASGELIARGGQFREELVLAEIAVGATRPAAKAKAREAVRSAIDPAREPPGGAPAPASSPDDTAARAPDSGSGAGLPERRAPAQPLGPEAEVYAALTLGLRDYVRKNGFAHVAFGLSGGIDSALVACLAVDALGADGVSVAIMPSPYSSKETQQDARTLADRLGIERIELDIEPAMRAYERTLAERFAGREADVTEENLQARIRGNLLMALSNKFGWLVLATGNKSEMSVGYSTLYGDLAGGFAPIKDCSKTTVRRLCEHRNALAGAELIPRTILERPPSAELRPDQRDEDSLPPYPVLDRILEAYVESDLDRDQIVAQGLPAADVDRVLRLVDLAEYKRRQAPPGVKITTRAFGRDRRMPITQRYRR